MLMIIIILIIIIIIFIINLFIIIILLLLHTSIFSIHCPICLEEELLWRTVNKQQYSTNTRRRDTIDNLNDTIDLKQTITGILIPLVFDILIVRHLVVEKARYFALHVIFNSDNIHSV